MFIHTRSFESEIDRLFDEALQAVTPSGSAWMPSCNAYEAPDGFYVQVSVPGVDPAQIEVRVEDQQVWITGERKHEANGDRIWHVRELLDGPFSCSFRVPAYVDTGKSTASYKDGLLKIMFPKCEEAKPRRIMIEAK